MAITRVQCRAGRALIEWTQERLAEESGLAVATIENFETGRSRPHEANRMKIRAALESGGVIFVEHGEISKHGGPGVRLRS